MGSTIVAILLSFSYVLGLPRNSAGLQVSPSRATRYIGDKVRLNCSDPSIDSLHWKHVSVRSSSQTFIYSSGIGMFSNYELGGRHSVEGDDSSGSCDLLIERVSEEDAGTYTCRRDDGEYREIELIIIVSMPTCESNPSLTDVLVENDCGLEPDSIELKCSIGYHGNVPPTLQWRHSSDPDVIVSSAIDHQKSNKIAVINSVTRKSNIRLNGTTFICSVDEVEAGEHSYGCATREVSVMYLFNTTESRSIEKTQDDQPVRISCVANTSQPCNYRWRGTTTSTKNPIELLGQTIDLDLFKQDFEDMRCSAECRLRDKDCTVEPQMLIFSRAKDDNSYVRIPDIPLIPGLFGLIVLCVVFFIWKYKRYFVKCWKQISSRRITAKKATTENATIEEVELLGEQTDVSNKGRIEEDVRKLVERLNPDKSLFDRLMSKGVLSVEDNKTLTEVDKDKENLLKILSRLINTRRTFNSFLAVLVESDQYFRVIDATVPESIQRNISRLIECLDVDNGLADCLFSRGVLSSEQYERLTNKSWWSSFQEQNRELLANMLPSRLKSVLACKMFMAALVETDQRHIFNFIINSTDNAIATKDDPRILTADELSMIERNSFQLINSLDPSPVFLESLLGEDCITKTHKNRIEVQQTERDKNKELLGIVRRRSYEDFKTFKRVIRATQKDGMIIKLLEQGSGHVISLHCEINIERETPMSSEHLSIMETKVATHLSDSTLLSQSLSRKVANQLNGLHKEGIDMIGATPTGSVIVYFSCQTFQSIVAFKQMVVNRKLTRMLEELFNRILGLSAPFCSNLINRILGLSALFHVKLMVSLSETEYQTCIEAARRTIYSEKVSTNRGYMLMLPREMLEMILLKSMVGIMSVDWMANVGDNESASGSYKLYDTVANNTWMSAYVRLKSVTYQWKHERYLNRGVALKRFFLRRLHQNYVVFAEQLNCRYVLLDRLVEEKVITDEERKNILEDETHFKTRINEYIPEYIWPQVESDKQMLTSNEKLIACLNQKNYSQILKFLELMEENCSTHVLNYFISNQHLQTFGDVWPIEQIMRLRMTNRQQNIVKEMDVLIRMEALEKCDKKGKEEKENGGTKEDNEGGDEDDGKKVEDVDGDGEDEEEEEFVDKEDKDVEEKDGNNKKEKEGDDRGRKEYESEDNEGIKEESKHHRMDGSNQGIDEFHGNMRRIEEGAWREKVSVEEEDDMKGEEDVSEEDAMSDEDKFKVDATTDHMRSRWIPQMDDESIPDRVNLIDLLYNEGCISFRHKQQIEQRPTQQLQNIEMVQLIKNGSIQTLKLANEYFIRTGQRNVFERMNKIYPSEDVQLIGTLTMEGGSSDVYGVAWLENKIYVGYHSSNLVHVYPDEEPFDELKDDRIEIKEMKDPGDMAASGVSRSIFISDYGNIWRIQMPSKKISRWKIDGEPYGLSINSSDELIVAVDCNDRRYIYVYRCEDGGLIKEVYVGDVVSDRSVREHMPHVVQSSNGNFIIPHLSRDDHRVRLISEVSIDGTKIIRSFDPRSIESNKLKPEHLSIDEDDNIFVVDLRNDKVVLLNPRLDEHQILMNRDQHRIVIPSRLCYVREKQMLIVVHGGWLSLSVSLFSLSKHRP